MGQWACASVQPVRHEGKTAQWVIGKVSFLIKKNYWKRKSFFFLWVCLVWIWIATTAAFFWPWEEPVLGWRWCWGWRSKVRVKTWKLRIIIKPWHLPHLQFSLPLDIILYEVKVFLIKIFLFYSLQSKTSCEIQFSPFYVWENWGSRKLNNFSKIAHLISAWAWVWTQVYLIPLHSSPLPLIYKQT